MMDTNDINLSSHSCEDEDDFDAQGWTSITVFYRSDSDAYSIAMHRLVTSINRGFTKFITVVDEDDEDMVRLYAQ